MSATSSHLRNITFESACAIKHMTHVGYFWIRPLWDVTIGSNYRGKRVSDVGDLRRQQRRNVTSNPRQNGWLKSSAALNTCYSCQWRLKWPDLKWAGLKAHAAPKHTNYSEYVDNAPLPMASLKIKQETRVSNLGSVPCLDRDIRDRCIRWFSNPSLNSKHLWLSSGCGRECLADDHRYECIEGEWSHLDIFGAA
jgi:hypothetical protein